MPAPRSDNEPEDEGQLENKLFRVTADARRAFDMLKGEVGRRSGPRLIAEAIDLLLIHHGKEPVGPLRPARASPGIQGPEEKPKPA